MLIENKLIGNKGTFYVKDGDRVVAEMTYSLPTPQLMIIEHTEVDESLEGHGVGRQLVAHAVEYARTNNIKIIPLCPFAKKVFDKTKEYKDVLHA